jgi:hypothetical protein
LPIQILPTQASENAGHREIHTQQVYFSVPAKLKFALRARYVIAPLVFLDPGGTLGASLCVGQDPVRRLTFVLTLLQPKNEFRASGWLMGFFSTLKAECLAAPPWPTPHVRHTSTCHDDALAPWGRAPAHLFVVAHKLLEDHAGVLGK